MYSYCHYTYIFPESPGEQLECMNSVDYYNITENCFCLLRYLFQTIISLQRENIFLFSLTDSESSTQCYIITALKKKRLQSYVSLHQTGATS